MKKKKLIKMINREIPLSMLSKCYKENKFKLWTLKCKDFSEFRCVVDRKTPYKMKNRQKMKEDIEKYILSQDANLSYLYAKKILNGRFLVAEPTIAKHAVTAYNYAHDILYGPFPEGEKAILMEPKMTYYYSCYILRKRWPDGEKALVMFGDFYWIARYEAVFNVSLTCDD